MGKWKGIKKNLFKTDSRLQLYDLSNDPMELIDVSKIFPDKIKLIEKYLDEAHSTPTVKKFIIPILEN